MTNSEEAGPVEGQGRAFDHGPVLTGM